MNNPEPTLEHYIGSTIAGERHIAGCCKVSDPPVKKIKCTKTTCEIKSSICGDLEHEYGVPQPASDSESLDKRTGKGYKWGAAMTARLIPHPTAQRLSNFLNAPLQRFYNKYLPLQGDDCPAPGVRPVMIVTADGPPPNTEVEHAVPRMLTSRFPAVANHGRRWTQEPMHPRFKSNSKGRRDHKASHAQ